MSDDASRRRLGTLDATALVVASMVGTGIFTTSGLLAEQLNGPWWVLLVWIGGGLLALCGADVYAELGAMMPRAGGEYVYLREAFHPAVGFLSGWVSLIVGFSAPIAASAIAFGRYSSAVAPTIPSQVAALALIAAASFMHMASVTWGGRVQTFFTILKVGLLLVLVVGGLALGEGSWDHVVRPPVAVDPGNVAVALVLVSFAYSGWNGAAYLAGEIVEPGRNLPRALLGGTGLVVALFVALNVVFFFAVPTNEMAGVVEVGHLAARRLFGEDAGVALSSMIGLALVSSVSAMLMAGPRVYVAMAEDGLFFRLLAKRSSSGAPWAAVGLQGLLAAALAATATFEQLLVYIGFTLSLFSALAVVAAVVLRRRQPDRARPYRARGWPITPLLYLTLSLWMVAHSVASRPVESLAGLATLTVGLVVYGIWYRPKPSTSDDEPDDELPAEVEARG